MSVRIPGRGRSTREGITGISIAGFKSIAGRQRVDVRPLTVLAGVNSSGKSSMLQPLLLLKQTLLNEYDPGPLLLDGPNARFTSSEQVLSHVNRRRTSFTVGIEVGHHYAVETTFRRGRNASGFSVASTRLVSGSDDITVRSGMTTAEIEKATRSARERDAAGLEWALVPIDGSFLVPFATEGAQTWDLGLEAVWPVVGHLREIIHVPAWRGSPQRSYPTTGLNPAFPGTFDTYVASVIAQWRGRADSRHRLAEQDLEALGLTSELSARPVDETRVELLVGRLPEQQAGQGNLENIADVGFGVSQVLPVVVAMLTAAPGQLVYIEEPEIHLHPRAQLALAGMAVRAANRRARVVLETHSSLLLRGIQTAIAAKDIGRDQVGMHWFSRSTNGTTTVRTAEVGDDGSFGEWPVDFDEVTLAAERAYLDIS
jgi:predicted ATPase